MARMPSNLVVILSPYAGDVEKNVEYARDCMRESLKRGEHPYAVHLLMPQVLDDAVPAQREEGMAVGWSWMAHADLVAVYTDRGISSGMMRDIEEASRLQKLITFRSIELELKPFHIALLSNVHGSPNGEMMLPAHRDERESNAWRDLFKHGYLTARDRLQQMASLTAKGHRALGHDVPAEVPDDV
jgi:hypothetical protein